MQTPRYKEILRVCVTAYSAPEGYMRQQTGFFFALGLLLASMALVGCSPEAGRVRSGGPGADVGNRGVSVDMHANSDPSYQEPEPGRAIQTERNSAR